MSLSELELANYVMTQDDSITNTAVDGVLCCKPATLLSLVDFHLCLATLLIPESADPDTGSCSD